MSQIKRGLGRGLSALIPTDDMNYLSRVARGEVEGQIVPAVKSRTTQTPSPRSESTAKPLDKKPSRAATGAVTTQKTKPQQKNAAEGNEAQAAQASAVAASVSNTALTAESVEADSSGRDPVAWIATQDVVANPYQPRRHFDEQELSNLASSIREHGVLQPILVRPVAPIDGAATDAHTPRFQLVAGERRWRAAQAAQIATIPAIIRAVDDQQALELAVIENVQRHDISPLDAALAYRRLASEFGLSQEKISQRVGKSRSSVANTVRLLELPPEIQQALNDGTLSEGHGRAILLAASPSARSATFRAILRGKLSVREAEEWARRKPAASSVSQNGAEGADKSQRMRVDGDDWRIIAEELQRSIGSKISLRPRRRGGQITISCSSSDQMEHVIKLLRKL